MARVGWLTTRKQNHTPRKLSIRNSKLTKPQSLLQSFFLKASLFCCPFWFLSGSQGEDKLRLLEDRRGEQGQVQPRTSTQNIRKILPRRGLWRSPLPPPTQGRASFKADQVALQAFNVSMDRDAATFQRDLFQCLTKSPGEEFPSYSQNVPCCILWPLPLLHSLNNFERSLALSSL